MKIMKVKHDPYRKYEVKKLPKDLEYVQQDIKDNEIYFSKTQQAYFVIIQ